MDKVTQQNAANAEESASASEELSAQAEQMNEVVNELVALVGGNTGKRQSGSSGNRRHLNINVDHSGAKKVHEVLNKHHDLDKSDKVFHKIAKGSRKEKEHKSAAKSSAEKFIPLDNKSTSDDDFKEFNN